MDEPRCHLKTSLVSKLIVCFLLYWPIYTVHSEVYSISESISCIMEPCFTLSHFVTHLSHELDSNTTLVLLSGTHSLPLNLSVSNVTHFSIVANSSVDQDTVIICNTTGLRFHHAYRVLISGITFQGCGENMVNQVAHFIIENSTFQGTASSRTALVLNKTGRASIHRSLFHNCTLGSANFVDLPTNYPPNMGHVDVGGALVVISSGLELSNCVFEGNSADLGSAVFAERNSTINILDSTFLFNHGRLSGPGHVLFATGNCSISINNSTLSNNSGNFGVFGIVNSRIQLHSSTFSFNGAMCEAGGVITAHSSFIHITGSTFSYNIAKVKGGAIQAIDTSINIRESIFNNNRAENLGGTVHLSGGTIEIINSDFTNSRARDGGVLYGRLTRLQVSEGSNFNCNIADSHGGVLVIIDSSLEDNGSTFVNNSAQEGGGVMDLTGCHVTLTESTLDANTAEKGGAIYAYSSTLNLIHITLSNNRATLIGGVADVTDSQLNIHWCYFTGNTANSGAIINVYHSSANISVSYFSENSALNGVLETTHCNVQLHSLTITNNSALFSLMYIYQGTTCFTGLTAINNNIGSLYVFDSYVYFIGTTSITNCSEPLSQASFKGGGLTSYRSAVYFNGTTILAQNKARRGGGFLALESFVYVYGETTIASNIALDTGGGAYVYQSDFTVEGSTCIFTDNEAWNDGGGIHAISSLITTASNYYKITHLSFVNNNASQGGGAYFEANSRLYILKREAESDDIIPRTKVSFTDNHGSKGGAIYVADETNSRACAESTECFFQVLSLHMVESSNPNTINIFFSNNFASEAGDNIFGGLLDRCLPSTFAEIYRLKRKFNDDEPNMYTGLSYITRTSNVTLESIASSPVRVCFCVDGFPDCDHQPQMKTVKKGETFSMKVIAVDQIGHPLSTNVTTSLKSTESGLFVGQVSQHVNGSCTNLSFSVESPRKSEKLFLHTEGPCNSKQYSTAVVPIEFGPCVCPIGFDAIETKNTCKCTCASVLSSRITNCNVVNQSFVKTDASWISYTNETEPDGYIIHPNCPFEYCLPPSSSARINLNTVDGADTQCNKNRRGTLCGACKEPFSLSLGSSLCLECPSYWPGLLVTIVLFVIVIGVGFVAALMFLNLTVAVGTLNAIIFYVNVINLQRSVYFPFQDTTYQAIFVAGLNFDFSGDLCFYDGMDAYLKTWLKLVFPSYIILLVILVIVLSKYSSKFANFIGKRDPVATLATLILFSYTRLLDFFVEGLTFTILSLPDGSVHYLWLPDANVNYFLGKHAPLFIVTILILLICVVFTLVLFLWQWIVKYEREHRALSFIHCTRFASFIETYHIPFNAYARHWTGLLLLVRVILYLVTILNFNRNPHVQLTATAFTVGALLMFKGMYTKPVYRKWLLDVMETVTFFNIIAFSIFTSYTLESDGSQPAVAVVSASITLIMLIAIIAYHIYTYTCVGRLLTKMNIRNRLARKLRPYKQRETSTHEAVNSDIIEPSLVPELFDMSKYRNSIFEAIEAPTESDYLQLQQLQSVSEQEQSTEQVVVGKDSSTPVKPTYSTVELSNEDIEASY